MIFLPRSAIPRRQLELSEFRLSVYLEAAIAVPRELRLGQTPTGQAKRAQINEAIQPLGQQTKVIASPGGEPITVARCLQLKKVGSAAELIDHQGLARRLVRMECQGKRF